MPQEVLSLASGIYQARQTRETDGWTVPWEVESFSADAQRAQSQGGLFDLSDWAVAEITGKDAADFLNRMSTLNFKDWDPKQTRQGAFLTGRSGVVVLGFFQSAGNGFEIIVPAYLKTALLEHLEKFHFAEEMTVTDRSADWAVFGIYGQATAPKLPPGATTWVDAYRPSITWVKFKRAEAGAYLQECKKSGLGLLGRRFWHSVRRSAGLVSISKEIDSAVMVLEANLEKAVDRNKGCYPGQEVVERIFTYGNVNRKILPVTLQGEWAKVELPFKFTKEGRPAGVLVSLDEVPGNATQATGLAFIYRAFWEEKAGFEEAGVQIRL